MLFRATLDYAQQNVGLDQDGQPLPPVIGEDVITQMRDCIELTKGKILTEVKAQKLADSMGSLGWRAVKGKLLKNLILFKFGKRVHCA